MFNERYGKVQKDNTQKAINKLKPGEHFGEKALLNDNDLRNAVVVLSAQLRVMSFVYRIRVV